MTGKEIKAIRETLGWSYQQMASNGGFSKEYWCKLEKGDRAVTENVIDAVNGVLKKQKKNIEKMQNSC